MDFEFLENTITGKWVISAPRRSKRPNVAKGAEPICPFCPGREKQEKELYRVGGEAGDHNWKLRVVPNKFPFAPIHEIIIHSPDHHKNFDELPLSQSEMIIKAYKERFLAHQKDGLVYIFNNHGEAGGESLPHPHSQLVVIPEKIQVDIPGLQIPHTHEIVQETEKFVIFCPKNSQWPDETWIFPKRRETSFGEITDEEIKDFAKTLYRVIQIFDIRHGHEFPFNFYIYPKKEWYLRLIPRIKTVGGFELGTGVFVNTQKPGDTIEFIREHFVSPNEEKIRTIHRAQYRKTV